MMKRYFPLALLACTLFATTLVAAPVLTLTTNTTDELVGTLSWTRADLPFPGGEAAGTATFNQANSGILFNNFPGGVADQNLIITDLNTGFFDLQLFVAGGGVTAINTSPTTTVLAGTYSDGLAGGDVNFTMGVDFGADANATRTANFNFVTAVPEPSAFLFLSLVVCVFGGRDWMKRGSVTDK